jgi:DNA excision repair protein ERCC-4/Fanconi anemia group M protein
VRAARLAQALHGDYVAPVDREPEPERDTSSTTAVRRWVVSPPDAESEPDGRPEPESFSRKAIALRAMRGATSGTQLIDSLTGEVVAEVDAAAG